MKTHDNKAISSLSAEDMVPVRTVNPGYDRKNAARLVHSFDPALKEYPIGSVLSIREIENPDLILYGQAYYIETSEFSIVRRIQRGDVSGMIRAYSTNDDRYPDGQLVHEPIDIPLQAIKRISLVIGFAARQNH